MRRFWRGILLLALLSTIAVGAYYQLVVGTNRCTSTRSSLTAAMLEDTLCGIDLFTQDTGQLPAELGNLLHMNGVPGWDGPYLKNEASLRDRWKQPILYLKDARYIELRSAGRDRRLNTSDDVIRERLLPPTSVPAKGA